MECGSIGEESRGGSLDTILSTEKDPSTQAQEGSQNMTGTRKTMHIDRARQDSGVCALLQATFARAKHSWSKSACREFPLKKFNCPWRTMQCPAVAPATLTAVLHFRLPDCWKKLCRLYALVFLAVRTRMLSLCSSSAGSQCSICFRSPKRSLKKGCRGTAGADFRSMSCWSSLTSKPTLSMCKRSGELFCAFCSRLEKWLR